MNPIRKFCEGALHNCYESPRVVLTLNALSMAVADVIRRSNETIWNGATQTGPSTLADARSRIIIANSSGSAALGKWVPGAASRFAELALKTSLAHAHPAVADAVSRTFESASRIDAVEVFQNTRRAYGAGEVGLAIADSRIARAVDAFRRARPKGTVGSVEAGITHASAWEIR